MLRFIVKRLVNGFFIVLGVILVVFFIFQVMPGDPVDMMLGQRSDIASKETIKKEYGLDKPLLYQLGQYVNDLSPLSFHEHTGKNKEKYHYLSLFQIGNTATVIKKPYLRRSFQDNRLVSEIIWEGLKRTAWLAVSAMLFASIIGILMGVFAALHQNSWIDYLLVSGSILGISIPSFVTGVLISFLFAVHWQDLTNLNLYGYIYQIDPFRGGHYQWKNLLLPMLTLGIRPLAIITQLTRSSMLDVMKQDYIRTAKAKGLPFIKVVFKHALRNALNPVVTAVTGWLASLMAGAFFVEVIFSWGGLGAVTVNAVFSMNFPVVMGATLMVSVLFVIVNIVVDIMYAALDPRIRLE